MRVLQGNSGGGSVMGPREGGGKCGGGGSRLGKHVTLALYFFSQQQPQVSLWFTDFLRFKVQHHKYSFYFAKHSTLKTSEFL